MWYLRGSNVIIICKLVEFVPYLVQFLKRTEKNSFLPIYVVPCVK